MLSIATSMSGISPNRSKLTLSQTFPSVLRGCSISLVVLSVKIVQSLHDLTCVSMCLSAPGNQKWLRIFLFMPELPGWLPWCALSSALFMSEFGRTIFVPRIIMIPSSEMVSSLNAALKSLMAVSDVSSFWFLIVLFIFLRV